MTLLFWLAVVVVSSPIAYLWIVAGINWITAVFGLVFLCLAYAVIINLYTHNPTLLAERFRLPGAKDQPGWDRRVVWLVYFVVVVWFALVPLGIRFGWGIDLPIGWRLVGLVMLLESCVPMYLVFASNPFLSPLVRVQNEQGHHLVVTGVYSVVRHPMYFGVIALLIGGALWLSSPVGVGLALLLALVLGYRIRKEEAFLTDNFPDYQSYCQKVRYRLLPFVW